MKVRVLAAYAVPLVLLLSACGGGDDSVGHAGTKRAFADQSPTAIKKAALAAMKDLKSVRMTGTTGTGDQPVTIDIVMDAAGDCRGSISIGIASSDLLAADGHAWLKPDTAFWMNQLGRDYDSFVALKGKWVEIPDNGSGFSGFCDLEGLVSGLAETKGSAKVSVQEGTVDGEHVVRLTSHRKGQTLTTLIAADEPHHLLQLDSTTEAGGTLLNLVFAHFDEPLKVKAPAPGDATQAPQPTSG